MTNTNEAAFPELTSEDLEKIKQCATKKSFEKDEVIFSEGDEADNMYFIESGKLSVVIQKFTIKETVATLEAGNCVGEMVFFNGDKRSASVIAQTEGVLLVVNQTNFMRLLSEDEELASRVKLIVEARNNILAAKETLVDDHTTGNDVKFHLGIKGDPSLRESAFMRERYESTVDPILPQLQLTLYELLANRCVYEVLIHFNSGEVLVKSIFNPFVDEIHQASKLISKAYINRHFPLVDYDEKIGMIKRMMMHISEDSCMDNLDDITRSMLEISYKSWNPLKPKEIAQTVSKLLSLRTIQDFYLRNFTISMVRDSIRLQFNCDGTHLLDGEAYQEFLKDNLIDDDELFEVDRRNSSRRNVASDLEELKMTYTDRRSPPGRRKEDWEVLYQALNV
jgi:hypothetical protein